MFERHKKAGDLGVLAPGTMPLEVQFFSFVCTLTFMTSSLAATLLPIWLVHSPLKRRNGDNNHITKEPLPVHPPSPCKNKSCVSTSCNIMLSVPQKPSLFDTPLLPLTPSSI